MNADSSGGGDVQLSIVQQLGQCKGVFACPQNPWSDPWTCVCQCVKQGAGHTVGV